MTPSAAQLSKAEFQRVGEVCDQIKDLVNEYELRPPWRSCSAWRGREPFEGAWPRRGKIVDLATRAVQKFLDDSAPVGTCFRGLFWCNLPL